MTFICKEGFLQPNKLERPFRNDLLILTSLWCPDCDHFVGLMQLAETLGEHLDVVGGVWFQHGQLVAGLVAMSVHTGPLLGAHEPEDKNIR